MDVELHYTLIVLITIWQVLSFWSNFVCQHVMKQITRYGGVILSHNSCSKIGSNAFEKKKSLCPFSSAASVIGHWTLLHANCLITIWQVLSFWSNFVCQHVMKQITRYVGVILSRNSCRKIGSNAFEKKKNSFPFSSATARWRKPKKSLCSDWAEKVAESN